MRRGDGDRLDGLERAGCRGFMAVDPRADDLVERVEQHRRQRTPPGWVHEDQSGNPNTCVLRPTVALAESYDTGIGCLLDYGVE